MLALIHSLASDMGLWRIPFNLFKPWPINREQNPVNGAWFDVNRRFTAPGRYYGPADIAASTTLLASPPVS